MICVDRTTMRRYLKILISQGWLEERSNPHNKWDKTSQYRLNLRKLQEDLWALGFELPGIQDLFPKSFIRKAEPEELDSEYSERAEVSNVQNASSKGAPSSEQISPSIDLRASDLPSEEDEIPLEERAAPSEGVNSSLYIQRLYTENKNKEYTQRTRARENFVDLEKVLVGESDELDTDDPLRHASLAQDMVNLWEYHVVQKLFPKNWQGTIELTSSRKDQLESLLAFHFKNDMRLWERFCLRVKASSFLMGESPSGWHTSLDWILDEDNLRKILEGNYDNSHRIEDEDDESEGRSPLDNDQPNPLKDAEKAAILSSIKDSTWRAWCTQLAAGVRLNELQMLHKPLSAFQLRQIASAHFLDCEDKRLIWVGSSDQAALNAIEALRLQINWVYAKQFPEARAIRTRLISEPYLTSSPTLGDNNYA